MYSTYFYFLYLRPPLSVPPILTRLSKFQTYHLTGSTATFVMNVSDAVPPVIESYLNWQGNYNSNQQTFDGERASLELNNLRVTDTGNITLTVNHPAGEISKYFELVVLGELTFIHVHVYIHVHLTLCAIVHVFNGGKVSL